MQHHSPSGEDLEDDDEAEENEKEEGLSEEGDWEELKQKFSRILFAKIKMTSGQKKLAIQNKIEEVKAMPTPNT